MDDTREHQEAHAEALISAGRFFSRQGWMPDTTGDLSVRLDAGRMAITRAHSRKGELEPDDLMQVDLEGNVLSPGKHPSPGTFLHIILYRRSAGIGAVLHTHSANAIALSRRHGGGFLNLGGYDLLAGVEGVDPHGGELALPVYRRTPEIPRLAAQVDEDLKGLPETPGFLVDGQWALPPDAPGVV
ncbi:MAG: class II aldolase/adducin family protein, partial [Ectothiorhodospira sp.]